MSTERWSDDGRRRDGLAIVSGIDGWVIMPGTEGLPIDKCPCCDKPFLTMRDGRLVADWIYPMAEEPSDAAPG